MSESLSPLLASLEETLRKVLSIDIKQSAKNAKNRKQPINDWAKSAFGPDFEKGTSHGIIELMDVRVADKFRSEFGVFSESSNIKHALCLVKSEALPDNLDDKMKSLWNGTLLTVLLVQYNEKNSSDNDLIFKYQVYSYKSELSKPLEIYSKMGFDITEAYRGVHHWLYTADSLPNEKEKNRVGFSAQAFGINGKALEQNQDSPEEVEALLDNIGPHYRQWIRYFLAMREGDIVYAKSFPNLIVRWTKISSRCKYDPESKSIYREIKSWYVADAEQKGVEVSEVRFNKFIFQHITNEKGMVDSIQQALGIDPEKDSAIPYLLPYDCDNFLKDVFLEKKIYSDIVELLEEKKNIILQGPPGVGKTFMAMRLAWSIMGKKDNSRIRFVQFHQNYSYEDFILGWRPVDNSSDRNGPSLILKEGPFYEFCKEAEGSPDKHFLIIDEINRGNVSKIFGELLMLIEHDKRSKFGVSDTSEKGVRLLYRKEEFSVPHNIYIIGMMNTADRSLALIDYALRRRFAFVDIDPAFDTLSFKKYVDKIGGDKFRAIIDVVRSINKEISDDPSLGSGFSIGHSHFCFGDISREKLNAKLERIVKYTLFPLLREYWYDDTFKRNNAEKMLEEALATPEEFSLAKQTAGMKEYSSSTSGEYVMKGSLDATESNKNVQFSAELEEG